MITEVCSGSRQAKTLSEMLRFTPAKTSPADDIDSIITPPLKGGHWSLGDSAQSTTDTPCTTSGLDGSYTEICLKPLGRFLSFDVKRSLFSGKRVAEQMNDAEDSPATKRLREADLTIHNICLKSSSPALSLKNDCIKTMVQKLSTDADVIADGSRPYILPTVVGKHKDLKAISPDTMSAVLHGCYDAEIDGVTVIDCRYPYEFEGGHIQGAVNLYTRVMVRDFLVSRAQNHVSSTRHVLIFHCEFSSERGPKMYRHLRSEDRAMNSDVYPRLHFPEIYLLEGGYKAFFNAHGSQCEPQTYKPMLHKDHADDLRHFRGKSKSWTAGERPSCTRTSLRF
ncbi:M-phase inducer phosphatase 1-like [Dreissena polymorpha]|uniref:M-phase inducer phosphatase 1-like n=1 Tax=Dreissena polymorpha TaxID=45954 RepID=UPI0022647A20|nr:M-phase inducer phosphatase 1-like [Dreissena polymorpha]